MNSTFLNKRLLAILIALPVLIWTLRATETANPTEPAQPAAQVEQTKQTEPAAPTPAAEPAPAPAPQPELAPAPAPVDADAGRSSEIGAADADRGSEVSKTVTEPKPEEVKAAKPDASSDKKPAKKKKSKVKMSNMDDQPAIFGSSIVRAGEKAGDAVSVFGRTTIEGETMGDAVAILGPNTISGTVEGDAVSVLGNLSSTGTLRSDAVCVLGNASIDGPVNGDLVVVLGNLKLGPKADIKGETTVVLGKIDRSEGSQTNKIQMVGAVPGLPNLGVLGTWVSECLLRGRLLGFSEGLGFVWLIALAHLLFYVFLALILRGATEKCIATLEEKPGMSILTALLGFLLTPLVIILLAVTGIGAILLPFLLIGLFFLGLFGRVVMLGWMGRLFTRFLGDSPVNHVAISVLIGGLMVALLYCVPIVAFIVHSVLGSIGFGVVLFALIQNMKREKKPTPPAAPFNGRRTPSPTPVSPSTGVNTPGTSSGFSQAAAGAIPVEARPVSSAGFAAEPAPFVSSAPAEAAATPPAADRAVPPQAMPFTATAQAASPSTGVSDPGHRGAELLSVLPRATFWQRIGALAIDVVLVWILTLFINSMIPNFMHFKLGGLFSGSFLVSMAIYGTLLWKLRSTTIGGIILRLQVIRIDDRPLDWSTCIVRGLGCILSAFCVGLGFLWILWDPRCESWHDKIAGTAVVVLPSSKPLV